MPDCWVGDEEIIKQLKDVGTGDWEKDIPTESQALGNIQVLKMIMTTLLLSRVVLMPMIVYPLEVATHM